MSTNTAKKGILAHSHGGWVFNQAPVVDAGINQNITLPATSTTITGTATDPDGTVVSTLWTQTLGPACTITSPSALSTTITGMVAGTYVFKLTATDNLSRQGSDTITIIVSLAANILPIANIDTPNLTITLPTNSVVLAGSGSDADGVIVGYLWTKVSGPATFNIVSPTLSTTTINNLVAGTYQFQLRVTDNRGGTGTHTTNVTVNPAPNILPIANAGGNKSIQLPTNSVTLVGSGTDADGIITGYLWTQVSGPSTATIGNSTLATSTMSALVAGTYVFRLRVTDNSGGQHTNDASVIVTAGNLPPIANAGLDKVITLPTNTVNVVGAGTDTDGFITTYKWTYVSGPITYTIGNSNTASTAINNLVAGIYVFQLMVTDNLGATGTDTVKITVNAAPNILPIANAGLDQTVQLPTSSTTLIGSGTDTDGTIASYAWTRISGPNTPTIVSATSATTSITGLIAGTYVFGLTVTDNVGGVSPQDLVTVLVLPVPNVLPIANANVNQTITLPTNSVTLSGSGTDSDGTIASYLWTKLAGSPSGGAIANATSASTTVTGLIAGVYTYQLQVTDNSGGTAVDTMTITVNAAPPPPIPLAKIALQSNPTVPITTTTITLPTASVALIDATFSPGYPAVAWLWTRISGPAGSTITTPTAQSTTITGLVQSTYVFQLQSTIAPPWNYQSSTVPPECRITVTVNPTAPASNIYYISSTGDNARTATQAKNINTPWKTLSHACTNVSAAGSIIHILPGTYNETQACNLRVGVSIEGEGATSNVVSTYAGGALLNLVSGTDATNGNQSVSNFKIDGSNLTGEKGILVRARSNVKIFNMTIQNFLNDGVIFKSANDENNPTALYTGNELHDCIITNNSDRFAGGQGNIVATGYRGLLIYNNIITQTSRPLGHNGNTFSATTLFYNEGLKFYNNKSYRNPNEGDGPNPDDGWSFHLELWDSQGDQEIYNNEFYGGNQQIDFGGNNLTKGGYVYGAYIHDNLFQMNSPVANSVSKQHVAINIEGNCEYITVSNNHFKNFPYGVQLTTAHSSNTITNTTIKNNLFENGGFTNPQWGFDITVLAEPASADGGGSINNLFIYNNTIITNSPSALFFYINTGRTVNNVSFINNIVRGTSDAYIAFMGENGNKTNYQIKNNLLYQNGNSNTYDLGGTSLPTAWTYTGNFVADPLLNAAFRPQISSPAINAGINVGLPFNGAAPDLGAFES